MEKVAVEILRKIEIISKSAKNIVNFVKDSAFFLL